MIMRSQVRNQRNVPHHQSGSSQGQVRPGGVLQQPQQNPVVLTWEGRYQQSSEFRDELGISNGVSFKGRQVLIRESRDILQQLHIGHQGMQKTRLLTIQTVYWPNINHQIDELIRSCDQCQKHMLQQRREPLIPHEIPTVQHHGPNLAWICLNLTESTTFSLWTTIQNSQSYST